MATSHVPYRLCIPCRELVSAFCILLNPPSFVDHPNPIILTRMAPHHPVDIIDIRAHAHSATDRGNTDVFNLRDQILGGLSAPRGQKSLTTLLLYDEHGLRLYDQITTQAPEYYLFAAEEEILKNHGDKIAQCMHAKSGSEIRAESLVELGAG